MPDMKTCTSCFTEIDGRAKVCPHCCQLQHGKVWRNAVPIAIVLVGMVALIVMLEVVTSRLADTGEAFSKHRAALRVGESGITFGQKQCSEHKHDTVAVLGILHNDSDITWREIALEVSFYDDENRLVDATQHARHFFCVPAQASATFKVSRDREFPRDRYVSHKVRILSAKDARSRY